MRLIGLLIPLSFCMSLTTIPVVEVKNEQAPQMIEGGTVSFDFADPEDSSRFALFTSYETLPTFVDDTMYMYLYAEQKAILSDIAFEDCLVEADFGSSVYKGHMDMGIYVQATNPGDRVDAIKAWEVNIEHDENNAYWKLKLHKFDYSWQGVFEEKLDMPFWNDEWIHLSVLVKGDILTAYINNDYDNPMFSHNIGAGAGHVGIRSFKAPGKVKNFQVTSPKLSINTEPLSALIDECDALNEDNYTPYSWNKLQAVLLEAKAVLSAPKNQLIINDSVKALKDAKDKLVLRKTYQELQTLIAECEQITDAENYTKNSYQSFLFCLNRAKGMTESSSIEDISYNYMMLEYRKNELIRYGG